MPKVAIIEVLMEKCLLDMPYEILFEIFCGLSKGKLIEISKLSSKLGDVAGDTRVWKNVYINYVPFKNYSFEELYSEPWPVNTIDLSRTKIYPPITSQIDQVIKVTKLDLSLINANETTMAALLNKYQCKELHLMTSTVNPHIKIAPKVFSKQTALETLSLGGVRRFHKDVLPHIIMISRPRMTDVHLWLSTVLANCKNLKTLDMRNWQLSGFDNLDMSNFVKNLPTSLEKLQLTGARPKDYFFKLLAENVPNLKELELNIPKVKCRSLLKFQFLETLHVIKDKDLYNYEDIIDLHMDLIKFPALKTVRIGLSRAAFSAKSDLDTNIEKLGTMLQPYGITVGSTIYPELSPQPKDGDLWNGL